MGAILARIICEKGTGDSPSSMRVAMLACVGVLFGVLLTARAAIVAFAWDDTVNPPATTYRLYEVSGTNYARLADSTNRTVATVLDPGRHTITVRAVLDGIESEDSNHLELTVPSKVTISIVVTQ